MNWQECWATGGLSHFVAFLCGGAMGLIFGPMAWAIWKIDREIAAILREHRKRSKASVP